MLGGHAARITGVACSPDGTMIASSSEDGTVKLWSTNGALLRTLNTQPYPTTALPGRRTAGASPPALTTAVTFTSQAGVGLDLALAGAGRLAERVDRRQRQPVRRHQPLRQGHRPGFLDRQHQARFRLCRRQQLCHLGLRPDPLSPTRPAYNTSVGPAAVTSVAFSSRRHDGVRMRRRHDLRL